MVMAVHSFGNVYALGKAEAERGDFLVYIDGGCEWDAEAEMLLNDENE